MKTNIILVLLLYVGLSLGLVPKALAQSVINGSQVFNSGMAGQTWVFTNNVPAGSSAPGDLGHDQTFITIEALPPNNRYVSNCVAWNYSKSRGRAYWSPGSIGAGIRFILCPQPDGSWVAAGSLFHGATGSGGVGNPWSSTQNIAQIAGEQFPAYLIVPANSGQGNMPSHFQNFNKSGVETYNSIVSDPQTTSRIVPWQTNASMVNICVPFQNFCGNTLVSEQIENCDSTLTNPGCLHEKWYFAPNLGLVQVDVLFQGNVWAGFCAHDPDAQQCFTLDQVSMKRTF